MTMLGDTFVYLSGLITAKGDVTMEQNIAAAVDVYLALIRLGIPTFCPHLTALCPSAFAIDYEQWIDYDLCVIRRCTHVLTLPRWEQSSGAMREVEFARQIGVPVLAVCDVLSGEVTL